DGGPELAHLDGTSAAHRDAIRALISQARAEGKDLTTYGVVRYWNEREDIFAADPRVSPLNERIAALRSQIDSGTVRGAELRALEAELQDVTAQRSAIYAEQMVGDIPADQIRDALKRGLSGRVL